MTNCSVCKKVLEYLEHGELVPTVPVSIIDQKITEMEEEYHNEPHQFDREIKILKEIKKEAKLLPDLAAIIQEIKSSQGHEYYT